MNQEVIVADPAGLKSKVAKFRTAGASKIRVISDWDRTLTFANSSDGMDQTTYSIIANENVLGDAYGTAYQSLYDRYRIVESESNLSISNRESKLHDWWTKQFELMVASGFSRKMISDLTTKKVLQLREGISEFFRKLTAVDIPILVLSAGIEELIVGRLKIESLDTSNVRVIANRLSFNPEGQMTGYTAPPIHSLSKWRRAASDGNRSGDRNYVLLLGDTREDAEIDSGLDSECAIRFGFLNSEGFRDRQVYASIYDLVICGDGDMMPINETLDSMLS